MTPDMTRLVEAATNAFRENCRYDDSPYDAMEPIVRAVLMALREPSEAAVDAAGSEWPGLEYGWEPSERLDELVKRANVAMLNFILAEPAKA